MNWRLGAKLKELRERKGATQAQVAAAIGVSRYMIWRLEKGRMKNSASAAVARLADYFGVSVEEMLGELPDDLAPDVESMLRRAGRQDARDRFLLDRMIRLTIELQAARDQRVRQLSSAAQQGRIPGDSTDRHGCTTGFR